MANETLLAKLVELAELLELQAAEAKDEADRTATGLPRLSTFKTGEAIANATTAATLRSILANWGGISS